MRQPTDARVRVTESDLSQAPHLAAVYNAQFASCAPSFCPPISPDEFVVGMTEIHDESRPVSVWGLDTLRLISVARRGSVVGFAHVAVETRRWEEPVTRRGLIRVFTYDRRDREAGEILLRASERFSMERGLHEVCASPWSAPVRFLFTGREGASTLHPHILSLLSLRGYSVAMTQHIMDLPRISACEPCLPDPDMFATVKHTSGPSGMPGIVVRIRRGDHEIGKCTCLGLGREKWARETQDRLLVRTLGVEEVQRGMGFGRYLLQRALWEGASLGYTSAHLRVYPDSHAAIMLYASEGFRIGGTGHQLTKSLVGDSRLDTA